METQPTTLTLKALRVNEHGHPTNRGETYEVSCELTIEAIVKNGNAIFPGDYIIVTRNEQTELIAVAVYPTFQRVSQALTKLREGKTATHYNVMEVA